MLNFINTGRLFDVFEGILEILTQDRPEIGISRWDERGFLYEFRLISLNVEERTQGCGISRSL